MNSFRSTDSFFKRFVRSTAIRAFHSSFILEIFSKSSSSSADFDFCDNNSLRRRFSSLKCSSSDRITVLQLKINFWFFTFVNIIKTHQ